MKTSNFLSTILLLSALSAGGLVLAESLGDIECKSSDQQFCELITDLYDRDEGCSVSNMPVDFIPSCFHLKVGGSYQYCSISENNRLVSGSTLQSLLSDQTKVSNLQEELDLCKTLFEENGANYQQINLDYFSLTESIPASNRCAADVMTGQASSRTEDQVYVVVQGCVSDASIVSIDISYDIITSVAGSSAGVKNISVNVPASGEFNQGFIVAEGQAALGDYVELKVTNYDKIKSVQAPIVKGTDGTGSKPVEDTTGKYKDCPGTTRDPLTGVYIVPNTPSGLKCVGCVNSNLLWVGPNSCLKEVNNDAKSCPGVAFNQTTKKLMADIDDATAISCAGCSISGGSWDTGQQKCVDASNQFGPERCPQDDPQENASCVQCLKDKGTWTALGCIVTTPQGVFNSLVRLALGIMGGVALFRLIYLGYLYNFGGEDKIKPTRDEILATLGGLVLVTFSVLILRIIGVNVLDIVPPGFFGS